MKLSIVIPCYNEEAVLPKTNEVLLSVLFDLIEKGKISETSSICYIDDGSSDKTWQIIEAYITQDDHISGLKLSRNWGHQNALLAGLFNTSGDILVSIDADLQDDVHAIEQMIDTYEKGYDIVYGVRNDRATDTRWKHQTAEMFYRLLACLGVKVIYNHADYRLMSRRAVNALKDYREVNLFLRGLIPLIGFRSSVIYYKRGSRVAGKSKYPFRRMLALAWNGITSLSIVPLRCITIIGCLTFLLSIAMGMYVLGIRIFTDRAIPGWASILVSVYFLGGIQLFCIGILGEYLGKVFNETKMRPRFLIEQKCGTNI